ncbi:Fic family protein [Kiritimatiellaeota bacterium B1221]|nr:Fic family protein [Kiritimatiellaeota bacterium B1221]
MPKRIDTDELAALVARIDESPKGIDAVSLRNMTGFEGSDKTLQRRLNRLADEGRILKRGRGTGTRYFPLQAEVSVDSAGFDYLSTEAKRLRKELSQPVSVRKPVGYQSGLLERYQPNRSWYLPEGIRDDLMEMGRVERGTLPAGTYLRQVMDRLIIDLSWNSSRLEGNTYSLLDTQRLLERSENVEGKSAEETQMILNHKSAIEMLADDADEIGFNRYTICNLHALLSENLLPDPMSGGRLRTRMIGIAGSVYEPLQVPHKIEEYFDEVLRKAEAVEDPFEQSFFVMVHLPYLQPFDDVNKRVSRLAANIPLVRQNLCPLAFVDVDEDPYVKGVLGIYERGQVDLLRDVFIWAYKRSCARYSAIRQSLGEPDPFRLRYRQQISDFVKHVVQQSFQKAEASNWIQENLNRIPKEDRVKFQEILESELWGLHEGNFARYRLRPAEFEQWAKGWNP